MKNLAYKKIKGFSLIELMVSIVIALIVLTGVIQMVLNSRRSYVTNQDISYIQDNTRYVISMLSQDIRLAGYKGCASKAPVFANVLNYPDAALNQFVAPDLANGFLAIEGYEDSGPDVVTNRFAGSDVIVLRHGGSDRNTVISNHSGNKLSIKDNPYTVSESLLIVDSNCVNAAAFTVSSKSNDEITHDTLTYNCKARLKGNFTCSQDAPSVGEVLYRAGSTVMPFSVAAYFIGESDTDPAIPALKRTSLMTRKVGAEEKPTAITEEIAVGVSGLEITYGLANEAGVITNFAAANDVDADEWNSVAAVRFTLIFIGESNGELKKPITSTVYIRNRG